MKKSVRRAEYGFTLVEVLIVVVILAVQAAVVVPQFSVSSDDAKDSTAQFNVSTFRSVIQTYRAQHNGLFPAHDDTAKTMPGLINKTKADGTVDASGPYGPYLVEIPDNPYTNDATVTKTTKTSIVAADVSDKGWLYNPSTGQIWLDSDPGFDQ